MPPTTAPRSIVLRAIVFLVVLTLFRLAFCTHLELVPDEAYYWEWSRHLDACYRDKGPAIAWTIAAGTWLGGDTVFGVRWIGVLLAAGTAWQVFVLTRRLYDESVAFVVLVVASIVPLLAVGSIIMTIDSLSVFFWAWAMNLAWEAVESNRKSTWAWLGFAIGCGFLAKFTNILQLGAVFLYLLWTPSVRRLIFSSGTVLMAAVFAFCTTPILWWNIVHHWPNRRALESRSGVDAGFHLHLSQLFRFLQEQALVISPLLWVGMVVAIAGMWIYRAREDRVRFLLCGFLPVYGCFTFFSLNSAGKANWTAPALVTGVILMVVFWQEILVRSRLWRIPVGLALFLAFAETVVLHETSWLHLNPQRDPLQRARGWDDLAAHTQAWQTKYGANLVIANHYSQASILSFYLPGQPATYTPPSDEVDNQYALWPGYAVGPETSAIFVSDDIAPNAYPAVLRQQFKHVALLEKFFTRSGGRPVREFQIYLFSNREIPGT